MSRRQDWRTDSDDIVIPPMGITTPPSVKPSKRQFGLTGDESFTSSERNSKATYAHGLQRQTGITKTSSEKGRHPDFYESNRKSPPRGKLITPGQSIEKRDSLAQLPPNSSTTNSQSKEIIPYQSPPYRLPLQITSQTKAISQTIDSLKLEPVRLTRDSYPTRSLSKKKQKTTEVIDLVDLEDDEDDDDDSPSPPPTKPSGPKTPEAIKNPSSKLSTLIEGKKSLYTTKDKVSFGSFPSIQLDKVFVGRKNFSDPNICKLEFIGARKTFRLSLPDQTSSIPSISSTPNETQMKKLSLTQEISFKSVKRLMFVSSRSPLSLLSPDLMSNRTAVDLDIGISFIAFHLSDISWNPSLLLKVKVDEQVVLSCCLLLE
jgi:hypothetical protein